jgi:hypothetical protein
MSPGQVSALKCELVAHVRRLMLTGDQDALVDIARTVYALGAALGVPPDVLEELRASKAAERGGFADHIVLLAVSDDSPA